MTTLTYAERIAAWRQGNPDKRLTFELLLEICDATNLRSADLRGAYLEGAEVVDADLTGANLWAADLRGANLMGADLWGASLGGANLGGANLWRANLMGADLWGASLGGANLKGANLWRANLSGANLKGANLWGANWSGLQITGLPSGQIVLTPTPDGWELRVGCWTGTIDGLRKLIAQDEGWPEADGDEITRRRPGLQVVLALIDEHIALRPNVISELKTKWGTK